MRLLVTREVRWPTGAEKKTKTGYPPVKRTNAHRSRRCQKEARLRAVTPLEALTATISPNAETERPSSMPPVAGNGLGEHRARRPTGSRRASRQDDRPCVVVSRGRHPNRRSIRRRGLAAKHCPERSDSDDLLFLNRTIDPNAAPDGTNDLPSCRASLADDNRLCHRDSLFSHQPTRTSEHRGLVNDRSTK